MVNDPPKSYGLVKDGLKFESKPNPPNSYQALINVLFFYQLFNYQIRLSFVIVIYNTSNEKELFLRSLSKVTHGSIWAKNQPNFRWAALGQDGLNSTNKRVERDK